MRKKIIPIILTTLIVFGANEFIQLSSAMAETKIDNEKKIVITGTVFDSKSNRGVKDVYIKQVNTLNTVLSTENGSFAITLDKSGENRLSIVKEGYETLRINVVPGDKDLKVVLFPAVKYENENLPEPHTDITSLFNYSTRPISSNFSALYQIRYQALKVPSFQTGAITSGGWAINEVAVNGQIRLESWLGIIKVFRSRYPVDIQNFDFNPAYHLDTTQFQLSGGKIFKLSDKMDFYGGISYLLHFVTPDNRGGSGNKPIPYTSSYMDFPQTRQGPGITGVLGYIVNDNIILNGNATLYPVIFTSFDELPKGSLGYHGMLDAGINLKVETLPGIYVTGSYTNQFFFGFSNFLDDSNFFNIGVSLDPFKMANISAPAKMVK